jgi:hypothetical protein
MSYRALAIAFSTGSCVAHNLINHKEAVGIITLRSEGEISIC